MRNANGYVTLRFYDFKGRTVEREVKQRARITAKRIYGLTRTWDLSGKRISAFYPGQRTVKLVSYCKDGQQEIVLP